MNFPSAVGATHVPHLYPKHGPPRLQHQGPQQADPKGIQASPLLLSRWHLQTRWNLRSRDRRNGRSRPSPDPNSCHIGARQIGQHPEIKFLKMGKRRGFPASVAKGLRSLQRQRFQYSCGRPIHSKPGIPSQENELRNGIPRAIKEAQCGIRSKICLRVGVAPTALPKFFSSLSSPYGTGLTSAAPPALYGSHLRIGTETLLPRRGWP